jgi:MraZ protein
MALASGGAVFNDVHINGVDLKGRVSLPAAFRQTIDIRVANGDVAAGLEKTLRMVKHKELACIEVSDARQISDDDKILRGRAEHIAATSGEYPEDVLERLEAIAYPRLKDVSFDAAGRMMLPSGLRDRLKIGSEAVFVGMGRKFQIWNPDALRAARGDDEDLMQDLDDLLAKRGGGKE